MCNLECRYLKCRTGEHAGKYAFMCGKKGSSGCSFWGKSHIYFTFYSSYLFVVTQVVPEDLLNASAKSITGDTIDYYKYDSTYAISHTWDVHHYLLQCNQSLELHLLQCNLLILTPQSLSLVIHHLQTSLPLEARHHFLDRYHNPVALGRKVEISLYPFLYINNFFQTIQLQITPHLLPSHPQARDVLYMLVSYRCSLLYTCILISICCLQRTAHPDTLYPSQKCQRSRWIVPSNYGHLLPSSAS